MAEDPNDFRYRILQPTQALSIPSYRHALSAIWSVQIGHSPCSAGQPFPLTGDATACQVQMEAGGTKVVGPKAAPSIPNRYSHPGIQYSWKWRKWVHP